MHTVTNASETLYESEKSLVVKDYDKTLDTSVILKFLKPDCPVTDEIARYKNEYEVIRRIQCDEIQSIIEFDTRPNNPCIKFEDINAISFNNFPDITASKAGLLDSIGYLQSVDLIIRIVKAIDRVHQQKVIHNQINPSNIIYSSSRNLVKLIDFGQAGPNLQQINPRIMNNSRESDLLYCSPEQLGKIQPGLLYQSDYYALGMSLYRILCQKPAFDEIDPVRIVHCHSARYPQPPYRIKPAIPKILSDIIMRLIEKDPKNRYVSANQLLKDLNTCRKMYTGSKADQIKAGYGVSFSMPGQTLKLPFWDRGKELKILSKLTQSIKKGSREIVFISGPSGVGKTTLVHLFRKKKLKPNTIFVSAGFDQVRSAVPNGAIVDAISQFVEQILMQEDSVFDQFRESIMDHLGDQAQIMIDLFPDLVHIIGPQPAVSELPIIEERNRFYYLLDKFIAGIMALNQPMILFIDNLQWADQPSIDLLIHLLLSDHTSACMFIGVYQPQENPASAAWMTLKQALDNRKIPYHGITLDPFTQKTMDRLLSIVFHQPVESVHSLSKRLYRITAGNPFKIENCLKTAVERRWILFDPLHSWIWKLEDFNYMTAIVNPDKLSEKQLNMFRLDEKVIKILRAGAVLGFRFNTELLFALLNDPPNQVQTALNQCIQCGFLEPTNKTKNSQDLNKTTCEPMNTVQFINDGFRKRLYHDLHENEKANLHWRIGQMIHNKMSNQTIAFDLLEAVHHMNLGRHAIHQKEDYFLLSRLNLAAALKVKKASAYKLSYAYLQMGIDILFKQADKRAIQLNAWKTDYALVRDLYIGAIETAFLHADYEKMEQLAQEFEKPVAELVDRIKVTEIKIRSLYAKNRLNHAIELAVKTLKRLNETLPEHPTRFHILFALLKTKYRLRKYTDHQLKSLPNMIETEKKAALAILSSLVLPAFYARPNLVPLIVFKGIALSLRYGNTKESIFSYAGFGMILCGVTREFNAGYQFGQLALDLLNQRGAEQIRARTLATVHGFILHWTDSLRSTLPLILDACQHAMAYGDNQYAAICAKSYCSRALYAGVDLEMVRKKTAQFTKLIKKIGQKVILSSILITHQVVQNLSEKKEDPWQMTGQFFNYRNDYAKLKRNGDRMALFTANLAHLMLGFIYQKTTVAKSHIAPGRRYLKTATGLPDSVVFIVFETLTLLRYLRTPQNPHKGYYKRRVRSNIKCLKHWSEHSPDNFKHLYHLSMAEMFYLKNENDLAKRHYTLSIELSNQHQHWNYEAIANELAAQFYLKLQDLPKAHRHILMAHHAYSRWGALGKCFHLESTYPMFFNSYPVHFSTDGINDFDVMAFLKASQAILKTMDFSRLKKKLFELVTEYSGAQKACLIFHEHQQLRLEAMISPEHDTLRSSEVLSGLDHKTILPLSMILYCVRSGQTVILNNAVFENKFSHDSYIQSTKPLSVLCMPLIRQNAVAGLLYLENNLYKGAFSKDHLKALDIFASQLMICIENAELYETLKKQMQEKDQAVVESQKKQTMLEDMTAALNAAEDRERKKIARDLHDSAGQYLAFSISKLKSLKTEKPEFIVQQCREVSENLSLASDHLKDLTFRLSPPFIGEFGFETTLDWLCEDLSSKHGLRITFMMNTNTSIVLEEPVKMVLYRVIRELALNTIKHAGVTDASLTATVNDQGYGFILLDKGCGFDVKAALGHPKSFGLISLYQRVEQIQGRLNIESKIGQGTTATIHVGQTNTQK